VYQISNSSRFQIGDQLTSYSNDQFGDIFSMNSSFSSLLSGSSFYDIILTQRRYTRNTASASFSTDVTGKGTNVRVFGSYDNYWYGDQSFANGTLKDYYSAKVGAGLNQRITRWLSLGSNYYIQLNKDLKDSQTHRIEVGNLQFDLSPNVEIHASGGVAISKTGGEDGYRTRFTTRAGISYSAETTKLYADYSRTMMSVSGFSTLLPSDTFLAGVGQPIGDRANLRVSWYYQRSSDSRNSGILSAHQGMVSMGYAIIEGLYASVNYSRRYQENSISSLSGIPHASRTNFSFGLQYTWPTGRTR
jgi:hypothetical protein